MYAKQKRIILKRGINKEVYNGVIWLSTRARKKLGNKTI